MDPHKAEKFIEMTKCKQWSSIHYNQPKPHCVSITAKIRTTPGPLYPRKIREPGGKARRPKAITYLFSLSLFPSGSLKHSKALELAQRELRHTDARPSPKRLGISRQILLLCVLICKPTWHYTRVVTVVCFTCSTPNCSPFSVENTLSTTELGGDGPRPHGH